MGTGAGSAIVRRVVDNLQGILWGQPAREGGAAFHLNFPLAPETPGAPPIPGLELVEPVPTLAAP
jgi:signal transduction histidine kinase